LIDVWTLVWRYTIAPETLNPVQQFWFAGLLLTGLTFIVIGAFLGSIGRAARKAELPPTPETTRAETAIQETAAGTPHPVAPGFQGRSRASRSLRAGVGDHVLTRLRTVATRLATLGHHRVVGRVLLARRGAPVAHLGARVADDPGERPLGRRRLHRRLADRGA